MEQQYIFDDLSWLADALKKPISLQEVNTYWELFLEENYIKKVNIGIEDALHEIIELDFVASGLLTMAFISGNESPDITTLQSLLIQIVNTELAIYKLTCDGLDYQAEILLRTLLELFVLLINLLLDKDKRAQFRACDTDKKTKWYKLFRFPKMINTIKDYERENGLPSFSGWIEENYSFSSSYVHNNFFDAFIYSRSNVLITDPTYDNLFGSYVTRTNKILYKMAEICYVSLILFVRIFKNCDTDISETDIYGNEANINPYFYWKRACELVPIMVGKMIRYRIKDGNSIKEK